MVAKRILVVDDDPSIVDLLREVLSGRGYEVGCADNATTALELIKEQIFDAAIVDFDLPDMNGVMLHREIRRMDEELAERTLFISGMIQSEGDLDYYQAFGVGFLSKPFQVHEILRALDGLWEPAPSGL